MNSVLSAYGMSNMLSGASSGGFWWNIIGGIVFSIIGWYAFRHGKREKSMPPMVIGIALMVYPYFVYNTFWAFAVGLGLCAALYFWRE